MKNKKSTNFKINFIRFLLNLIAIYILRQISPFAQIGQNFHLIFQK